MLYDAKGTPDNIKSCFNACYTSRDATHARALRVIAFIRRNVLSQVSNKWRFFFDMLGE